MNASTSNRLVWTLSTPTIPGFYFYLDPDEGIIVGEVYYVDFTKDDKTYLFFDGDGMNIALSDEYIKKYGEKTINGKWAGPIPLPTDE